MFRAAKNLEFEKADIPQPTASHAPSGTRRPLEKNTTTANRALSRAKNERRVEPRDKRMAR